MRRQAPRPFQYRAYRILNICHNTDANMTICAVPEVYAPRDVRALAHTIDVLPGLKPLGWALTVAASGIPRVAGMAC
jgi:hypothetical protein